MDSLHICLPTHSVPTILHCYDRRAQGATSLQVTEICYRLKDKLKLHARGPFGPRGHSHHQHGQGDSHPEGEARGQGGPLHRWLLSEYMFVASFYSDFEIVQDCSGTIPRLPT